MLWGQYYFQFQMSMRSRANVQIFVYKNWSDFKKASTIKVWIRNMFRNAVLKFFPDPVLTLSTKSKFKKCSEGSNIFSFLCICANAIMDIFFLQKFVKKSWIRKMFRNAVYKGAEGGEQPRGGDGGLLLGRGHGRPGQEGRRRWRRGGQVFFF